MGYGTGSLGILNIEIDKSVKTTDRVGNLGQVEKLGNYVSNQLVECKIDGKMCKKTCKRKQSPMTGRMKNLK